LKTVFIFLAVTLLFCGLTFVSAQQTSTNDSTQQGSIKPDQQSKYDATTGKKFVGKIVSIDHDAKTFTVMPIDVRTGTGPANGGFRTGNETSGTSQGNSGMSQGSSGSTEGNSGTGSGDMAEGTMTFKYNSDTKYHRDGNADKDFRISDLDKGDDVVIQYDGSNNAILISKLQPSEKSK
jgi:hypothetical protein